MATVGVNGLTLFSEVLKAKLYGALLAVNATGNYCGGDGERAAHPVLRLSSPCIISPW